jgi:hypothetical protein
MSILVLCPSRARPQAAEETLTSFLQTRRDPATRLLFLVDDDDSSQGDYPTGQTWICERPGSMNAALNMVALNDKACGNATILGFIGDDHRFRTPGWDLAIDRLLTEHPGFAYGDDLAQRQNLPTQVFVNREIVLSLGWFGLPGAKHLYLDNAWKTLGEQADCLYYVPSVVIEHLHPAYGKGVWDEGHVRVNSVAMYDHDRSVFERWLLGASQEDISRVRAVAG